MPELIKPEQVVKRRKETTAPGTPGPKLHSPLEYDMVMELVARMSRRGHTQHEIREALDKELGVVVGQGTVSTYLKQVRVRYQKTERENSAELVGEKLAQIQEVRKEAWAAYERSKQDTDKSVQEWVMLPEDISKREPNGSLKSKIERQLMGQLRKVKEIITRQGRVPGAEYLRIVMDTLEAEREMLGLDEAKKVDITQTTMNWDFLAGVDTPDPIEEKIEQVGIEDKKLTEPILLQENDTPVAEILEIRPAEQVESNGVHDVPAG